MHLIFKEAKNKNQLKLKKISKMQYRTKLDCIFKKKIKKDL